MTQKIPETGSGKPLPDAVTLMEVGPRDGFQQEQKFIPTDMKMDIIQRLVDAGLKQIQVVSFVHPEKVPQMADAEAVAARLPQGEDVIFTGLVLNTRGVERAARAGLKWVEVSISASDAHSRKNAGMSLEQGYAQGRDMIRLARSHGMGVIASIQCTFGCAYAGEVAVDGVCRTASVLLESGVERLSLADTTGMGTPLTVRRALKAVLKESGQTPVGLHLHDTRGLGLVNLMEGLSLGVRHFDTSFGGLGGCPFVKGAAGNIATEDTVYLLETLGIQTGVDRRKVAECARQMADFFGKPLAGKLHRLTEETCEV